MSREHFILPKVMELQITNKVSHSLEALSIAEHRLPVFITQSN